ncbi:MAG: Gfo/Idh/MocA family oxidoreductase [Planctomycetes bacterium]|nr:Gfo/Idh/MocA family oxidoreductase [Planctomycetota bacterium]
MTLDRRNFLSHSGKCAAGLALASSLAKPARAESPNNRVNLAIVGVRGRGHGLMHGFASRPNCNILYLCDVDQTVVGLPQREIADRYGAAPKIVQDFRRALDDAAVDAMVIATPDHWHALATIWACQAGKDVYVEKPVSHSIWEGRKMVEAARKYKRIVQTGTQNRSAPYMLQAKQYIDSGKLGTIHLVRVYNQKHKPNIHPVEETEPPPGLDWDMWQGPATQTRYSTNFHNEWHAFWKFSGGDIANDAVHQLDIARWMVGADYPTKVSCYGGKFAEQGLSEMPDTQVATFEFPNLIMTLDLTLYTPYMIKSDQQIRDGDMFPYWPQNTERVELFGTKGLMVLGRMGAGWQVFDRQKNRQPVVAAQAYGRFPDPEHQQNFLESVRSRNAPSADILEGHRSTLLSHIANISYRRGGRQLTFDAQTESFVDDREANQLLKRDYRAPWCVPDHV